MHVIKALVIKVSKIPISLITTAHPQYVKGQCFIFKRNNQRVSWFCWAFIACSLIVIIVLAIVAGIRNTSMNGLDFLNYIAYIKLVISFIKYLPQAYMNYKRQSTVGWSIGNVLLDFTGGSFSIIQGRTPPVNWRRYMYRTGIHEFSCTVTRSTDWHEKMKQFYKMSISYSAFTRTRK